MVDAWRKFGYILRKRSSRVSTVMSHIKFWEKYPDHEYYNKEVKLLNLKVRRVYSKRKLGQRYQVELKRLSKELLATKKTAQETSLRSVLRNEGNCLSEF
jgi:hypothetical protein